MIYIDKTLRKQQADVVVGNYIVSQRNNGYDCSYYNMSRSPYKNRLRDILIAEQNNLCCYCMKKLKKDETTTIEHVIPKGPDTTEAILSLYKLKYPNYFTDVIHRDQFFTTSPFPPFPHQIAYQNLVVACNGILQEYSTKPFCCNQKRGHKEIVPLIFNSNIANIITYTRSGVLASTNDDSEIKSTITVLNLNNDTLKEIRILWAKIKHKNSIHLFNSSNKRELLLVLFGVELISMLPSIFEPYKKYFTDNYFWSLLGSYLWFHDYYPV
jgi:hypothetical protein